MTDMSVADEAELYLRVIADPRSEPSAHECVACYVARMVESHGCDTSLRWAQRFRELRSPTATGLERRLGSVGGFCDCEILLNGYALVRELMVRDVHTDDLEPPTELPDCAGVGRTSTRPCANWERRRPQ
ncbi:DUF2695 domain-containing protein [Nocardioides sp. YIM 152315]|uniref:DUF2695 domain-containing protein n=1 Tax=Nocardioides sp. YIM 152315 TaxID=3031760 RepID=UPI0023DA32A4|nr:DUF2695 domain-containing protein [Nocardioides sp. YIM 152315]MDF1603341.1 DUF2695 domain-containing protein [Nocardioides sp. YIM 152315]